MLKKRIVLLVVVALAAFLKYRYAVSVWSSQNEGENPVSLTKEKKSELDS